MMSMHIMPWVDIPARAVTSPVSTPMETRGEHATCHLTLAYVRRIPDFRIRYAAFFTVRSSQVKRGMWLASLTMKAACCAMNGRVGIVTQSGPGHKQNSLMHRINSPYAVRKSKHVS
jgi:hypothetical protein